jgi:glycosyltransferase involved in cell wall biosynthesis
MQKPRRVLVLVENLSVPFDRRVWKECRALREAGYQVTAISPKGHGFDTAAVETVEGVVIYRYAPYESSGGAVSYAVEFTVAVFMMSVLAWVAFFRRGFDLIHICNPPDVLVFVALPFKLLGKKIIFDQHDLSPEIFAVRRPGADRSPVYRVLLFLEYLTYRLSDVTIGITQSVCDIARSRGKVEPENLFLVRNGPDLSSFVGARADDTLKKGKRFLLSYIGMMGPQDGVDVLLRCVRILVDEFHRTDFHVHLVGGGTQLASLEQYARELGIEEYVTFAGMQPYDQVVQAVASADLCVCPDPKTPMNDRANLVKVSEYMCLGKPVVCFDLTEVRFSAADAALYAEAGDERDFAAKVHYLLENPQERARLGRIGATRVRELLSWDHSKKALSAAYDRACSMFDQTQPSCPEAT